MQSAKDGPNKHIIWVLMSLQYDPWHLPLKVAHHIIHLGLAYMSTDPRLLV